MRNQAPGGKWNSAGSKRPATGTRTLVIRTQVRPAASNCRLSPCLDLTTARHSRCFTLRRLHNPYSRGRISYTAARPQKAARQNSHTATTPQKFTRPDRSSMSCFTTQRFFGESLSFARFKAAHFERDRWSMRGFEGPHRGAQKGPGWPPCARVFACVLACACGCRACACVCMCMVVLGCTQVAAGNRPKRVHREGGRKRSRESEMREDLLTASSSRAAGTAGQTAEAEE
jgi:hypothetical protein